MARLTTTLAGQQAAGIPGAVAGYVIGPVLDAVVPAGATTQLKTAAILTKLARAIRGGQIGPVDMYVAQLKRIGATTAAGVALTVPPNPE